MYRILVVDDDRRIGELFAAAYANRFSIAVAGDAAEALAQCEACPFDMVIADINMPDMSGIELLHMVRSRWPKTVTVLMTGYDINSYLRQARELGVANVIAKTAPFNFVEIATELEGLLSGQIFGLQRYLLPDGAIVARYEVRSSDDARRVRLDVAALVRERFCQSRDIELVVDEIVSNAVYHAPAYADGTPKYEHCTEVQLERDEYIQVEVGADSEKYGVSVTDNSGRLTKETVLERIERHASGQGLTDLRGRGIHISRMLSDRMVINIKRGERTEVILMNYFGPRFRGVKPLYVNEL